MQLRKRLVLPVILLGAFLAWIPRQQKLNHTKHQWQQTGKRLEAVTTRVALATNDLAALEEKLSELWKSREVIADELRTAKGDLATISPGSQWAVAPEQPEWNKESPYAWVRKEIMERVKVPPFGEGGTLQPEFAEALAITQPEVQQINATLQKVLTEYSELETRDARLVEEHLTGIDTNGTVRTLSWEHFEKEGKLLKNQFEETLRQVLGEQRSQLLLKLDGLNLQRELGLFGSPHRQQITLVRHADETYSIAVNPGELWMYQAMAHVDLKTAELFVPKHLRHFFADLLE